jgi:hypothetical protein
LLAILRDRGSLLRARRVAAGIGLGCLVPASLYVAFLPVLTGRVAFWPIAVLGLAGCLIAFLPAGALWGLETRRGAAAATRVLVGSVVVVVCLLAMTADVGPGPLIIAALMQVSAYGFGRHLADRIGLGVDDQASWHGVPLCIALGWAVLIVGFLTAGSFGWLNRPVVTAIYLAGVAAAMRAGARPVAPPPASGPGSPPVVWWWGLTLLLLIGFVGALAPEVRHDALAAHLPIAREFAVHGAIVEMRHNTASYFQIHADLLYATAMVLIPDERLPKLLHFSAGVIATLAVYTLGSRLWDRWAGLIGAALFAGTPLVWWLAGTVYTDLWLALFSAAAVHAVLHYRDAPGPRRAFAAGMLAGAMLGVKIPSAALAVPLLAVLLVRARGERRIWATVGAVVAGAVLVGAYPYVRAWALVGNPVFPLLRPIFGPSGGLHPTLMLRPLQGMGAGLWDVLLLPWRVTRFPERFVEDASFGIAFLALLPLAVVAVARRRVPVWVTAPSVLAVLAWFWTSQYLRFALPMLPLLALVAGAGVAHPPGGRRASTVAAVTTAALLSLNAAAWIAPGPPNFPHTVTTGRVTRFDYATWHIRGFLVSDFARRTLPRDARILGAGEDWAYHYERFFVPISWYGWRFHQGLLRLMATTTDAATIQRALTAEGFTHLVVYPELPVLGRRGRIDAWAARDAFWEEGPRLLYAAGGFYLFDLSSPAGPRTRGPIVLQRPEPVLVGSSAVSFDVGASAGTLYALEAHVRSTPSGAEAAMAIEWISDTGRPLGPRTARSFRVTPGPRRRAVACTAPPGARRAIITLSAPGGQSVEFDEVMFYELR